MQRRVSAQATEYKAFGTLSTFFTISQTIAILSNAGHHLRFVSRPSRYGWQAPAAIAASSSRMSVQPSSEGRQTNAPSAVLRIPGSSQLRSSSTRSPACTTDPEQSLIVAFWCDEMAPLSHAIMEYRPSRSTSIKRVSALLKSSKNPTRMTATALQSTSLRIRERLGDDLERILVRDVSDPRFRKHHNGMPVLLQDHLDLMHPGEVRRRTLLEPRDSTSVSAVEAFRLRSIESRWRLQVVSNHVNVSASKSRSAVSTSGESLSSYARPNAPSSNAESEWRRARTKRMKRTVRACRRHSYVCHPSHVAQISPCEHARLDAPTWRSRARQSLRAEPAVASAARAGTWACPSPPSGPTTLASALQTRAPHRRPAWQGEALENCRCQKRTGSAPGRVQAGNLQGAAPVRTGNGLGHAKCDDDWLAIGRLEHPARGNPTNSGWRSEGMAHT